jgi:hypothetical protein
MKNLQVCTRVVVLVVLDYAIVNLHAFHTFPSLVAIAIIGIIVAVGA